jgi:CO dehydrogenase maturation factor
MTTTIAVAGKGGTGKTTLAGLLIRRLVEAHASPILAIDADPASNLNTVLGLPLEKTVGDVREETSEKARANLLEAGIAKRDLLDYEINSTVVEGVGVDLLAMGRPEGPGCYCAANNMLRAIVDTIAEGYPWVVIDNEAGLEHLSRRTTRDVDVLLIVSDATVRGITTAGRVRAVLDELKTKVGKHYLIVNRAGNGLTPELEQAIRDQRLELLAVLPDDPLVASFDAAGRPIFDLPDDSVLKAAFAKVLDRLPIALHG